MVDVEECHPLPISERQSLSLVNSMICAMLLVATLLTNLLLLVVFKRKSKLFHKSMFYKFLLNITVADLLTACISDPDSLSFLLKEYFNRHITKSELKLVNFNLLMFNSVSLITMAMLCIERVILLMNPVVFKRGMKDWQSAGLLVLTWFAAGASSAPYLFMDYVQYLTVFILSNVGLSFTCLVVLTLTYRKYLKLHRFNSFANVPTDHTNNNKDSINNINNKSNCSSTNSSVRSCNSTTKLDVNLKPNYLKAYIKRYHRTNKDDGNTTKTIPSIKDDSFRKKRKHSSIIDQQRVKKTFLTMLLVYLATYLPLAVMTGYMNLCWPCNCTLLHIMRDMTCIALLLSALLRPLNFIFRLRIIKNEVTSLLRITVTKEGERRARNNTELSSSNTGISFIVNQSTI